MNNFLFWCLSEFQETKKSWVFPWVVNFFNTQQNLPIFRPILPKQTRRFLKFRNSSLPDWVNPIKGWRSQPDSHSASGYSLSFLDWPIVVDLMWFSGSHSSKLSDAKIEILCEGNPKRDLLINGFLTCGQHNLHFI